MSLADAGASEALTRPCPRHEDEAADRICRRCGGFACASCCGSPEKGPLCFSCRDALGFSDRPEFLICPSCDAEPYLGFVTFADFFYFRPLMLNIGRRFFPKRWSPGTHGEPWLGLKLMTRIHLFLENRYGFLRRCAACDITQIDLGRRVGWFQAGRITNELEEFFTPLAEFCFQCDNRYEHGAVDLLSLTGYHKEDSIGDWISFPEPLIYYLGGIIDRFKQGFHLSRHPYLPAAYCTSCRFLCFRLRAGLNQEKFKTLNQSLSRES